MTIDPDLPMSDEHQQQLLRNYMQVARDLTEASEAEWYAIHGDTVEAGRRGDTDYLRRTIRADLTTEARSSMRTVMALETLNAYEEGMRRERNEH